MKKKRTLRSLVAIAAGLLSFSVVAQGNLENPVADSVESGIGLISGWHCTAKEIRVFVNGVDIGKSGVGSSRNDTASICGHVYTGYSILFNYNLLTPGAHTISVYGDGVLLETRQFNAIRSAGVPFREGASRDVVVSDFPVAGTKTRLQWSQAKQSFVVVGSESENLIEIIKALTGGFFYGNAFYQNGPIGGAPTTFTFILRSEFLMETRASTNEACFFWGDYLISSSGVSSNGIYRCDDLREGTYRARDLYVNQLGVLSGTVTRTPAGSTESITETFAGYDVVRGSRTP